MTTKSKKAVKATATTKSEVLKPEIVSSEANEKSIPAEVQVQDKSQQIKQILSKVEKMESGPIPKITI